MNFNLNEKWLKNSFKHSKINLKENVKKKKLCVFFIFLLYIFFSLFLNKKLTLLLVKEKIKLNVNLSKIY